VKLALDAGKEAVVTTAFGKCQQRPNGFHPLGKLTSHFDRAKNGKVVSPRAAANHYEDGLLAMANAACLVSTSPSCSSAPLNLRLMDELRSGKDLGLPTCSGNLLLDTNPDCTRAAINEKCSFAALVGYASSQVSDDANKRWNEAVTAGGSPSEKLPRIISFQDWRNGTVA
jgi:hypothetical protein